MRKSFMQATLNQPNLFYLLVWWSPPSAKLELQNLDNFYKFYSFIQCFNNFNNCNNLILYIHVFLSMTVSCGIWCLADVASLGSN